MFRSIQLTALCALALTPSFGQPAASQPAAPEAGRAAAGPPAPALPSAWQKPTGPYSVVMEEDPAFPDHTVYRPADLSAFPKKERLPIAAFSGPGCDYNGTAFRPFFTEVASHGFLLIANGPPEPKGGSGAGFPRTTTATHIASVNWAVAENSRKDSKYYQKLDTSKIAMMGQSCGGIQTLEISNDPRFTTIVMFDSGVLDRMPGPPRGAAGGRQGGAVPNAAAAAAAAAMPSVTRDVLKGIHVPMAYFVGNTDMAKPNAQGDFQVLDSIPLFLGVLEIPGDAHAGTFRQNNGGKFGVAGVAWLKWRLKGDQNAAKMFKGADCGLCRDPEWQIQKKKID
jgi:hypothetical protein